MKFFIENTLLIYLKRAFTQVSAVISFEKQRKEMLQSSVYCNVILHLKKVKLLLLGELGADFRLGTNLFALPKTANQ